MHSLSVVKKDCFMKAITHMHMHPSTHEQTHTSDWLNYNVLFISVRPEGVSVTGLGQRVTENTEVEVTCDVSRVKPKADIYWRKGLNGPLQKRTTTWNSTTFHLQSTYKVSFSRSDHNTKLYCLVTRHGDSTDVWGTASQTVNVACE